MVVLSGPDGKLLVDDGIAVSKNKSKTALDGISAEPIKYVINTHWHWDHTDGNEWVHDQVLSEGIGPTLRNPDDVLPLIDCKKTEIGSELVVSPEAWPPLFE